MLTFVRRLIAMACLTVLMVASAQAAPIKIMPLGDSITEGTSNVNYRYRLATELTTAGMSYTFVGSLQTNPGGLPSGLRNHEGHPGFNIDNISNGWSTYPGVNTWLGPNGYHPDIILMMLGTNDVFEQRDFAHVGDRLNSLITKISNKTTGLAPNAKLIVSTITPFSSKPYDTDVQWYNSQLISVVNQHIALGENIVLVDCYSALLASDISSDGAHPILSGYNKIADVFYNAIIPEPVTLSLLGFGGLTLLARRR